MEWPPAGRRARRVQSVVDRAHDAQDDTQPTQHVHERCSHLETRFYVGESCELALRSRVGWEGYPACASLVEMVCSPNVAQASSMYIAASTARIYTTRNSAGSNSHARPFNTTDAMSSKDMHHHFYRRNVTHIVMLSHDSDMRCRLTHAPLTRLARTPLQHDSHARPFNTTRTHGLPRASSKW
jgi:hypothetical protein